MPLSAGRRRATRRRQRCVIASDGYTPRPVRRCLPSIGRFEPLLQDKTRFAGRDTLIRLGRQPLARRNT